MKKLNPAVSVLLVIAIIIASLFGGIYLYFNMDYSAFADAKGYLSQKYDIPKSELKLVKHIPSHKYNDDSLFLIYIRTTTPLWIYSYKGEEIHVSGEFNDDYQLEEISQIVTKYLQENFDNDVCGVSVINNDCSKKRFNESDVDRFLSEATGYPLAIFIKSDDPQNDERAKKFNELAMRYYQMTNSNSQHGRHIDFYLIDDTLRLGKTTKVYEDAKDYKYFSRYGLIDDIDISFNNNNNPHIRAVTTE